MGRDRDDHHYSKIKKNSREKSKNCKIKFYSIQGQE